MHKFPTKVGPGVSENGATIILMEFFNLGTWKTPVTGVSGKSIEVDKFTQNYYPYSTKSILPNSEFSKIFANVPNIYVKSDDKNGTDVAELIRSTILKLCTNFMQKWCIGAPKMVLPKY